MSTINIDFDEKFISVPGWMDALKEELEAVVGTFEKRDDGYDAQHWADEAKLDRQALEQWWSKPTEQSLARYGLANAIQAILDKRFAWDEAHVDFGGFQNGWDYGTTCAVVFPSEELFNRTRFRLTIFVEDALKPVAEINKWRLFHKSYLKWEYEAPDYDEDGRLISPADLRPAVVFHMWRDERPSNEGWFESYVEPMPEDLEDATVITEKDLEKAAAEAMA